MTPDDRPAAIVDLSPFSMEPHVQDALNLAWSTWREQPLSAAHLLSAAVAVGGSEAFRTLREHAPGLDSSAILPRNAKEPRPPRLDFAAVPVDPSLAASFAIAEPFLNRGDRHIWGRDFVCWALWSPGGTVLSKEAEAAGIDFAELRENWLTFLRNTDRHRSAEEWQQWFDAASRMPELAKGPGSDPPDVSSSAGSQDRITELRLAPAAKELLQFAAAIADARAASSVTGIDLVLAAFARVGNTRLNRDELAKGASFELVGSLSRPDEQIANALAAAGGSESNLSSSVADAPVESMTQACLEKASRLASRVEGQAIYSHHLLAVALDEPLPDRVLIELERTQNQLRLDLRRGIARRWPKEQGTIWDEVLAPQLGDHGFQGISSDVWTTQDRLGYAVYADAIARGIQHSSTRAPFTIGVKAPWGAGKTSLMRMVRDRLEWPTEPNAPSRAEKTRHIQLTTDSRDLLRTETATNRPSTQPLNPVTNKIVLKALTRTRPLSDHEKAKAADQRADGTLRAELKPTEEQPASGTDRPSPDASRWRPTVWFNPWMYQSGEQVWAGLAHEIITQVTHRMSAKEKEYFWLHLNRSRVDEQAVRRKIYALVFERLVPVILGAGIVVGLGLVLWATLGWQWISASLLGLGPVMLGVVGFLRGQQVLAAPASGTFDRLVSTGVDVRDAAAEGLKGSYQQLVESPDYRSRTGFFYLMHSDLERVLDLVATKDRPLVIFVDDLDRCSPSTVVQVIEAVNLFLAGQLSNCIFVLAMDPAVVATHIEIAYGNLAERRADQARLTTPSDNLGWRFLEKIIQLPLTLPVMEQSRQDSFYAHLFEAAADQPGNEDGRPPVIDPIDQSEPPDEEEIEQAARKLANTPTAQLGAVAVREAPGPAGREAARRMVDQRLTAQSPDVQAALRLAGRHLNANPREIKRFANVFRFLVMINDERGRSRLESVDSLDRLAKIAVLTMRWPAVLGQLTDGGPRTAGAVLALLERAPDGQDADLGNASPDHPAGANKDQPGDTLSSRLKEHGLSDGVIDQVDDPEFLAFVRAKPLVGAGYSGLI